MLTYRDMCFCDCQNCANTDCYRHLSHVNWDEVPDGLGVAMSDFSGRCGRYSTDYKGERPNEEQIR